MQNKTKTIYPITFPADAAMSVFVYTYGIIFFSSIGTGGIVGVALVLLQFVEANIFGSLFYNTYA
jgi:hypothetical protein